MKLTAAQTWLVHTLEGLFLAAIVAGSLAGYQAVTTGNYGPAAIGGVILAAAIAVLSKGASASILNNANLLPAIFDTVKDIQSTGGTQPQVPPVVIHNNIPAPLTPEVIAPLYTFHPSPEPAAPVPTTPDMPTKPMPVARANTAPKAG